MENSKDKPEYIYFEGHRYPYSDELAKQIMSEIPDSFTVGRTMTLEQARAEFGDDFEFPDPTDNYNAEDAS